MFGRMRLSGTRSCGRDVGDEGATCALLPIFQKSQELVKCLVRQALSRVRQNNMRMGNCGGRRLDYCPLARGSERAADEILTSLGTPDSRQTSRHFDLRFSCPKPYLSNQFIYLPTTTYYAPFINLKHCLKYGGVSGPPSPHVPATDIALASINPSSKSSRRAWRSVR